MILDAYGIVRPQWKLMLDVTEAGNAFAEAVKQNYDTLGTERSNEVDELEDDVDNIGLETGDDDEISVKLDEEEASSDSAEEVLFPYGLPERASTNPE